MERLKRVVPLYFFTTYGKIFANNSTKYFTYQYDEYSFDTTAYFIYKRLQKEKLLEIRNNSAWIALTDEGRKAALQGYVRYKDGKNNRRITWSNLFSKVNLSIDTTKNILWIFIAILSLFALLGLPKGHSILTKLLQVLQALI